MRKFILMTLMAAVASPATASAHSRAEIRHDRREVREQRQDLREVRRSGDRRDVRDARRELREDRAHRRAVRYASPYRGWSCRPVRVGFQHRPAFYGSRYHIADYPRFGLHRPARFQQWIRYGDDLLLVNVRTGRVLRVIPNRYW